MDFEIIKTVIDVWDPIELLAHAPKDEYDNESLQILQCYTENTEKLGKVVFDVFQKAFNDTFSKNMNDCIKVANSIINQS